MINDNGAQDHSISLKNEGLPYHYRIRKNAEGKLYILDEISFSSLIELVEYHSKKSDGLCVCLKYAVRLRCGVQIKSSI